MEGSSTYIALFLNPLSLNHLNTLSTTRNWLSIAILIWLYPKKKITPGDMAHAGSRPVSMNYTLQCSKKKKKNVAQEE